MVDFNRLLNMTQGDIERMVDFNRLLNMTQDDVEQMGNVGTVEQQYPTSQEMFASSPQYDPALGESLRRGELQYARTGLEEFEETRNPEQIISGLNPIERGLTQGSLDLFGTISRLVPGGGKLANDVNRFQQRISKETAEYGMLSNMLEGAVRSLTMMAPAMVTGSFPAMLAIAVASQGDEAITEAEDAGLEGASKWEYVAKSAAIEGIVTATMQKFGLGGAESLALGKAAMNGIKDSLKAVGKHTLAELTEEEIISYLQALNQYVMNVNPEALTPENLKNIGIMTAGQTLMVTSPLGVASMMQQKSPLPTETTEEEKQKIESLYPVKDTGKLTSMTIDPIGDWVSQNEEKAKAIAAIAIPSRNDMAGIPFPHKSQEQRNEFANTVRTILGIELPKEGEVISDAVQREEKGQGKGVLTPPPSTTETEQPIPEFIYEEKQKEPEPVKPPKKPKESFASYSPKPEAKPHPDFTKTDKGGIQAENTELYEYKGESLPSTFDSAGYYDPTNLEHNKKLWDSSIVETLGMGEIETPEEFTVWMKDLHTKNLGTEEHIYGDVIFQDAMKKGFKGAIMNAGTKQRTWTIAIFHPEKKSDVYSQFEFTEETQGKPQKGQFFSVPPPPGAQPKATPPNAPATWILQLTDIVELGRNLLSGKLPQIVKFINKKYGLGAVGQFQPKGEGIIKLRKDIFKGPVIASYIFKRGDIDTFIRLKKDEFTNTYGVEDEDILITKNKVKNGIQILFHLKNLDYAAQVLAHELGHGNDWLPDKTMARGNILARIGSLHNFIGEFMAGFPGGENPLTPDEIKRLKAQVKQELSQMEIEVEVEQTIYVEVEVISAGGTKTVKIPVTQEDILAIWNEMTSKIKDSAPELYIYLAQANTRTKANIIKQAMKGMLPDEVRGFLKSVQVTSAAGEKVKVLKPLVVKKKVKQQRTVKPTASEIRAEFEKRFRDEIRKRLLLERTIITNELKKLTMWWNPFNEKDNKKYTAYRYSSVELYAEAISVLLNNPKELESRAPEFYRGFFGWLERKPVFQRVYYDLLNEIEAGVSDERTRTQIYADFFEHDRKTAALAQQKTPVKEQVKWLRIAMQDIAIEIKDMTDILQKDMALTPEQNAALAYDNARYSGAEKEAYVFNLREKVVRIVKKIGTTFGWYDFDFYLMMKRIVKERSTTGNPRGITLSKAEKLLQDFEKRYGPKGIKEMGNAQKAFWKLRNETTIPKLEESRMTNKELMDYISDNEYYATFDVTKYIDENYGKGTGAHIMPQIGTFESIGGPATATAKKDIQLISAINWNNAKRTLVDNLFKHRPDLIEDADFTFNGKFNVYDEPKDRDKRLLLLMHEGKLEGYYIPDSFAVAFEKTNSKVFGFFARATAFIANPFRKVFVEYNPGFWLVNYLKDYGRLWKNIPRSSTIPGVTTYRITKEFLQGLPRPYKEAFGFHDEVVEELLKGNMLPSVAEFHGWSNKEEAEIERMIAAYLGNPKGFKNDIRRPFSFFFHTMSKIANANERVPKVAALQYLKKYTNMHPLEVADFVRRKAGSPPFLIKGAATPITNNLLLFSNPAIQAISSDIDVFQDQPIAASVKMSALLLPKAMMWALRSGALIALLKAMGIDPEDEVLEWLAWLQKLYRGVSEYAMTNNIVVPLGMSPNGETISLRVPFDENNRLITGVFWKLLHAPEMGLETFPQVLDFTAGTLPANTPALELATAVFEYITGRNPYDSYRNRFVLSKDLQNARTMQSHLEMFKWTWNNAGGTTVYTFKSNDPNQIKIELEEVMGYPVVGSMVSRFIQVSDYGVTEALQRESRLGEREKSRERLAIQAAVRATSSSRGPKGTMRLEISSVSS